ncbi:MAG: hypothetical protein AAFP19_17015 [Bacteroidota bacterium]
MKNTLLTVVLAMVCYHSAHSQVKRQYKDDTFSQTTVVVKEEGSSDQAVLDDIDIDMIGMDQQIRITTEHLKAQEADPKTAEPQAEVILAQVETPAPTEESPASTTSAPTSIPAESTADEAATGNRAANAMTNSNRAAYRPTRSSGTYERKSKRQVLRNARFKAKKRKNKRKKRRKFSCYQF